jgi:hypothetical protein
MPVWAFIQPAGLKRVRGYDMKKFRFMVFAGMALLSLGLTMCSSTPPVDFSTLDLSQPVPVGAIIGPIVTDRNSGGFYGKYGTNLQNVNTNLQEADREQLLAIICGTVAGNWESIAERVKAKTGITLDGDQFMQDLQNGDTSRILSQQNTLLSGGGYVYSWDSAAMETDTIVMEYSDIKLFASISVIYIDNTVVPSHIFFETKGEADEFGLAHTIGYTTISLR